jgi:alkylation response protein AidB-like acyl-CoA dehydrogenase
MYFHWNTNNATSRDRGIQFAKKELGANCKLNLQKLCQKGLLHPSEICATDYHALLDGMGYGCSEYGALFMAQAHLWGVWASLLAFRPDLASEVSKRRSLLALAVTEKKSGADVYAMDTLLSRTRTGWTLTGQKTFITNAPVAKQLLVLVKHCDEKFRGKFSCVLIPKNAPGIQIVAMKKRLGLQTVLAADIDLRKVKISPEQFVGSPGDGVTVFRQAMLWERSLILSPAAGRLERLKQNLVKEAQKKIRMGRPLTEAPQFKEGIKRVELCISNMRKEIRNAAEYLDQKKYSAVVSLRTKLNVSTLYEEASRILLQLGGKEAFFSGSELEINFRDSLASSLYSGPNDLIKSLLAQIE